MDNSNQKLSKKPGSRRWSKPSRGVTILELLVVIAIVAILSAVAVPSFVLTTKKFRVSGEANAFSSDLQTARSEALKRGADVIICPSTDGTVCSGDNTWHRGWIIYPKPASGTIAIIKRQSNWFTGNKANSDVLVSTGVDSPFQVTFNRDGYAQGLDATLGKAVFKVDATPAIAEVRKCIVLTKAGRQQVQKVGTGDCT